MNKYLGGYLSSIPASEQRSIITYLEQNMSNRISLTDEELKYMLAELVRQKKPLTEIITAAPDEKPVDTYNRFYNLTTIDIAYLFKVIDALYASIDSYSYLSASYLSDIKSELDKLESKMKDLQAKKDYDVNSIVITETFKNTESFEKYNSDNAYLFTDRDGKSLTPVEMIHNNTDDMITLGVLSEEDFLHNKNGKSIAMIKVSDYRGMPGDTYCGTKYAIDNSDMSYWNCSVSSNEPVNVPMGELEAGGAYIRFKVYLTNVHKISEISITPFCVYPVEICKIIIDGVDVMDSLVNPDNVSTTTMTFNIHPTAADEVEIVMRQKNHTYDLVTQNPKLDEAEELWNALLGIKKESYIASECVNDAFTRYMEGKEEDITNWNNDYIRGTE